MDYTNNDSFFKLNPSEKKELYTKLQNHYVQFRSKLDLADETTFGLELEFFSAYPEIALAFSDIPWILNLLEAGKDEKLYNSFWQLTRDKSVGDNEDSMEGYELISAILTDSVKDWERLRTVCAKLKMSPATINDRCGAHIHFGASQHFQQDPRKILNFIKFYAVYEDILMRFNTGERINTRASANLYAHPVALPIKQKIDSLKEFSDLSEFLKQLDFSSFSSMLIENYISYIMWGGAVDTVEFRSPNGTLNPVLWQNYVNTYGKMLEHATSGELDEEHLDYMFKLKNPTREIKSQIHFERALLFADTIFKNNLDKMDFLRQYVKDGTETSSDIPVFSLPFWK